MRDFDREITLMTDQEIERYLEQLTFTIALDTEHFHAVSDHKRQNIQKDLIMNKQSFRALCNERERRIIAGNYKPY